MKFEELNIDKKILKALQEKGYVEATPIQEKAIPQGLKGKDILGCAQTGTGKTAAFLIPIIQKLVKHDKQKVRSLILTPTRELAIQIHENFEQYASHTNLKSTMIFGGVAQRPQERAIKGGVDVIIATPGRLLDLIKQKIIKITSVEIFVLDEADRMLDMGFLNDVKKIINHLPISRQTLFFSATMPKEIKKLTDEILNDPVLIEVTPPSKTADRIEQSLYYVDKANKKRLLVDILNSTKIESAIVFTRTKSIANRLAKYLEQEKFKVGVIHGNKSQNARQHALKNFKSGEYQILVATDIASRGIDINQLSHVFNYDIPQEPEAYVHRIGRTARAGNDGISISFCDIDELGLIKDIQKIIDMKIPVNREHNYPMVNMTPTPKKTNKKPATTNKKKNHNNDNSKNSTKSQQYKGKSKSHKQRKK